MLISFLWITLFFVAVVYGYFLWIAGISVRQIESVDDYFIAGRKLKAGTFFATLYAAEMSIATVFIAFFDLASIMGWKLWISVVTFAMGQFLIYPFVSPRIKEVNKSRLTLPGVLFEQYNSHALRLVSVIAMTIGFGGLFATEVLVGAQLVKQIFSGEAFIAAVVFIAALVTFYTVLGGFKNVIKTDRYQSAFVGIGILALVIAALTISKTPFKILSNEATKGMLPPLSLFLNLLVINIAYPFVDLALWQRVAAASDEATAKRGGAWGAGSFLLCWFLILGSAIILGSASKSGAEGIFSAFSTMSGYSLLHGVVAGIGLGALLAALLSSGDVFLITATQTVCMDLTRRAYFSSNPEESSTLDDGKMLTYARNTALLIAVVCLSAVGGLMYLGARVSDLVFVIYGSTTALLPAVFFVLVRQKESVRCFAPAAAYSSLIGILMGLSYGILSLLDSKSMNSILSMIDPIPGGVSTFNAASVSLVWSIGIFLVVAILTERKALFRILKAMLLGDSR